MEFWERAVISINNILRKIRPKPKLEIQKFMDGLSESEKRDAKIAMKVLDLLRAFSTFRYTEDFYVEKIKVLYKLSPDKIYNDLKMVKSFIDDVNERVKEIYDQDDKNLLYFNETLKIIKRKNIHPLARLYAITLGLHKEHNSDLINEALYNSVNDFQLIRKCNYYINFEIRRLNRRINELKSILLRKKELVGTRK